MKYSSAFAIVRAYKVILAVVLSVVLIAWIKQDALKNYWEQSYHNTTIWDKLSEQPIWQMGNIEWDNAKLTDNLTVANQLANESLNQAFYADMLARQAEEKRQALIALQKRQEEQRRLAEESKAPKPLQGVSISTTQKVFFVGDSLMQGVAPWVMKQLKEEYNVQSINLSKQSTGLSYDKFLNWPLTVETTFKQNPDIGLMVVFLGPNDPWAVPDPKNGAYVEFDTPRWHELYYAKMQRLIDTATANNSQIIWVLPPNTKKTKLNNQMIALRKIMSSTLNPSQVLVLNAQSVLGQNEETYSDSLTLEGRVIKMRTSDGIHFTTEGQKRIADAIFATITVF